MFGNFNLCNESDVFVAENSFQNYLLENDYDENDIFLSETLLNDLCHNTRFILGFGRGYFAGDNYMTYLVEKNGDFFWLHHNYDKFDTVGIFKFLKPSYPILELFENTKMKECIWDFDELLEESGFYDLVDELNFNNNYYERIPKKDFFGFDFKNSDLAELIFCEFQPQNYGSDYPHKSFDCFFHEPKQISSLDSLVNELSSSKNIRFYHDGDSLMLEINKKKFFLKEK